MASVIQVEGLSFSYGESPLFSCLSFEADRGEAVVLLGPSGSGKTTILRLLAGLAQPDSGRIDMPEEQEGLAGFRAVFQEPRLFPWLNVRGNLEFALRAAGVPKDKWQSQISDFLAKVGMDGTEEMPVRALSGGMAQRIALVRAFCCLPSALLLDEPFSALDPKLRRQLQQDLVALLEQTDVAVVMVTHDIEEAVRIGDSILILQNAEISMRVRPRETGPEEAIRLLSAQLGE